MFLHHTKKSLSILQYRTSRSTCSRLLTTATSNAIHNLQVAVEQFRINNYAQELPSRCKKEIIKAADKNGNGIITEEALCTMIDNIGASSRVSRSDIDNIIKELGDRSKSTIGAEKVLQII